MAASPAVGDHLARLHSNSTGGSNVSGGLEDTRPITWGRVEAGGRVAGIRQEVEAGGLRREGHTDDGGESYWEAVQERRAYSCNADSWEGKFIIDKSQDVSNIIHLSRKHMLLCSSNTGPIGA